MKSMIAAILFALALSANAGMVYADDNEHEGYNQHESDDHGDKDRYEHGDREHGDRDRHEHGDRHRSEQHTAERDGSHRTDGPGGAHYGSASRQGSEAPGTDTISDFLNRLWPF